MKSLFETLRAHESAIIAILLGYAHRQGYTRYTSTLAEAWVASVRGLTDAIGRASDLDASVLDFRPDESFDTDPISAFGRDEALKHRSRGVTLAMFLGLTKYYRDAFTDACDAATDDGALRARRRQTLLRLFDRVELGFCQAWSAEDAKGGSGVLESANRTLASEKNRYLTVLESLNAAVFVFDGAWRIGYANPAALRVAGLSAAPGACNYGDALPWLEANLPAWILALAKDPIEEPPRVREARAQVAGGERLFEAHLTALADVTAKTVGVVLRLRDMTDLRHADDRRREMQLVFDAIAENAGDGIAMMDGQGRVQFWNRAAEQIFGWKSDEILGRDLHACVATGQVRAHAHAAVNRWATSGDAPAFGRTLGFAAQRRDGSQVDVELSLSAVPTAEGPRALAVVRDVTERRRLEAAAHTSSRLEAVGRLAGGIAHEINTPVQFIGDSLYFLRDATKTLCALHGEMTAHLETSPPALREDPWVAQLPARLLETDTAFLVEEAPRAIERALEGVDRVATIVRAMKEFGHPGRPEMAPADLNAMLRNTMVVSRSSWKYVASCELEAGDLPPVVCHAQELNQVFLNLVVNAADAVRERLGGAGGMGTITLRSRVDGGEAVVEVQDTGAGIPAKLAHRMFQPFFTTKAVGSGTGQGLARAWHIIVDNHHGKIDFSSTEGEGTTFVVRIPVLQLPAPEAAGRAAEAASAALRASQQPAPLTRRVP